MYWYVIYWYTVSTKDLDVITSYVAGCNLKQLLNTWKFHKHLHQSSHTQKCLVRGAAALHGSWRRCRCRDSKHQCHHYICQVPTLCPTKLDVLLLINRRRRDFSGSLVLCFTEIWLSESIRDSILHQLSTPLSGLLIRVYGENKGRQNLHLHKWRFVYRCHSVKNNMHLSPKNYSHQLQSIFFWLFCYYISEALLADQITSMEWKHTDSLLNYPCGF